jgi:hypothetical protein
VNSQAPDHLPHIYALIAKAIAISDPDEFEQVMTELRAALKEHIQRIRVMAAAKLALMQQAELELTTNRVDD